MNILRIIKFIITHPLNKGRKTNAVFTFIAYQIAIRTLKVNLISQWVNHTKIILSRGETGITGNFYCGLMEYEDMCFLVHYLNEGDEFFDIGANVGSYTILASGVSKAKTIAFEPVPSTFEKLVSHIRINNIEELVQANNKGVSDISGQLKFTNDLNCMNRVNTDLNNINTTEVDVIALDSHYNPKVPTLIKIDVEGYESFVLNGGTKFFSNKNVQALIIELNGSGEQFDCRDSTIHEKIISFGFMPVTYSPQERLITHLDSYRSGGNTIYVKDIKNAQSRVTRSKPFVVKTTSGKKV